MDCRSQAPSCGVVDGVRAGNRGKQRVLECSGSGRSIFVFLRPQRQPSRREQSERIVLTFGGDV